MSHIRSRDTKPELRVRRWLWSHGYRYRLNVKSVPGKPDIVMRTYRTAIFVNGCFWHGHDVVVPQLSGCNLVVNSDCCKIPMTNREFWVAKIRRNQERDQRNYALLRDNGWQVVVIWECQLKTAVIEHTMREVEVKLNDNLLSLYKRRTPKPYREEQGQMQTAAEDDILSRSALSGVEKTEKCTIS